MYGDTLSSVLAVVVVIVGIVMAVGIAGVVLPGLPGLGLMWLAALGFGLAGGFSEGGWSAFVIITALAGFGLLLGLWLPKKATESAGVPRRTIWLGVLGGVIGFFVIPVLGVLIGGALGVFLSELQRRHDAGKAWNAAWRTLTGFGLAAVAQVAFGIVLAGTWAVWAVVSLV